MQFLFGYFWFLLGAVIYLLGRVKDYKAMAKANPDPKIVYSSREFFNQEWINVAQFLLGGVALVVFLPKWVGGVTVDFKNVSGQVVTTVAMQTLLMPFYFLIGYSGNSALFTLFGKYKKTLMNQVGVDSN